MASAENDQASWTGFLKPQHTVGNGSEVQGEDYPRNKAGPGTSNNPKPIGLLEVPGVTAHSQFPSLRTHLQRLWGQKELSTSNPRPLHRFS